MSILNYITDNKEWLFSGVGVVVLFALVPWVLRLVSRVRSQTGRGTAIQASANESMEHLDQVAARRTDHLLPSPLTRLASVTFDQIMEARAAAPPLQQQEVANRYVGLTVQWEMQLFSASKRDNDTVYLSLDFGPRSYGLIRCEVRLADYRELNVLPKGHPISIIGEIAGVDANVVRLSNVQLFIRPMKS